jgi:DNA-binding LacI/PurR family transcriptional regulator/signal transduction histidine kinase
MSDLTIGAVMEVLGGEYYGGILGGIERGTRERHARLLVFRGTPADVAAAPFAREVGGWIAVHSPGGLAALARLGLPLVTVAYHDPEVRCPAVVADNRQGVREAVRHLIAHGHRRIAFIGWLEYPAIAERYEGYRDALTESGLPCSPELVIGIEDNHVASGRASASHLLAGAALPCTAVVAGTDRNAVGVMEVLQAAGFRVPQDVAVIGFDDLTDASLADPPLTTLRTRFDEFGRRAANLLLDEIGGSAVPRTVHRVPVALIRRRSCGCNMGDNLGSPPGADALAASENSAVAAHLVRMALFPVPSEPGRVPGDIWPGAVTLIGGIDAALAGDPEPTSAALREAWQQAVRLTPDLDVLRAMSTLLSGVGAQRLAATPPDPDRAHRLAAFLARSELELWRARVAYRHEGMTHLEELTQNSPTVAMIVLAGKTGQAQELDWLRLTPARWGCLALYADATRSPTSTLTVAGTYRPSGPPVPDRGTHFVAGAFPPAEWYPAPGSAVGSDVLMLLPVASASRDWGVLALRGPIDAHGGYTAQRPNNMAMWGALLAAALERDALAAELAELADEDRKRAEQALRRSEATLAEAQRFSHMGSWVWDRATGTMSWSAEMFRLFDLDPQHEPPPRDVIDERLHPDDREGVHSVRARAVREKVDLEHEYRILLPDRSLRHVQATCHPVLNAAGDVVEVLSTVRDVTERKQAEHALREAQAALAHVTRVTTLGEVTASIAHEVNQPLLGIVSSASSCSRWLAAQPPNLQRAQRALERIMKAGTRASAVIDRVRTLVKRQPLRAEPVDLNEIVRDVIAMVRHELQRSGVSLKTRLAEALPAVPGDRVQLQQVVLNLILNAIDATREIEGRPRQMWVASGSEAGKNVRVEVRDSGVGLAPDSRARVFEAFYTTKQSGLGMGLSICKSIIEAHGGKISAIPNSPHGAIFQFWLPLVSDDTGVA